MNYYSLELAVALHDAGIKAGDEVGCCMCNVPELAYVMLAVNKLAAKMNSFSAEYNQEYIKEIIGGCSKHVLIVSDSEYLKIHNIVKSIQFDNVVIISRCRSLPYNPYNCDEYEPELADFYVFNDCLEECLKLNDNCISYDDFVFKHRGNYDIPESATLDTDFLITYTSGSTKIGYPKAIIHNNRSLIVSGRFHDAEVSGNPDIKGLRALAMIHPDSNTCLITCISDILMQGWCVAFEPEYSVKDALNYLIINKPNYANMTSSFWNMAAYKYLVEKRFGNRKLGFLFAPFAVGESIGKGEEYFLNQFLKKAKAGSKVSIKGFHLPYVTISIGGGDCEHGGIYYTLWKSLYSKLYFFKLKGKAIGMLPEKYVVVTVLKKEHGNYVRCGKNEFGIIAANSATTMRGYKGKKEETIKRVISDENGRNWISCNVVGYIDSVGAVHVKGRAEEYKNINDEVIYPFIVDDVVDCDCKNILSSTTVFREDGTVLVNIILNPTHKDDEATIIKKAQNRCKRRLSPNLYALLRYRIFHSVLEFPITKSGKRNIRQLELFEL